MGVQFSPLFPRPSDNGNKESDTKIYEGFLLVSGSTTNFNAKIIGKRNFSYPVLYITVNITTIEINIETATIIELRKYLKNTNNTRKARCNYFASGFLYEFDISLSINLLTIKDMRLNKLTISEFATIANNDNLTTNWVIRLYLCHMALTMAELFYLTS